jgi:hypothetical protein
MFRAVGATSKVAHAHKHGCFHGQPQELPLLADKGKEKMSASTKLSQDVQQSPLRRIWRSPTSASRWYWLAASLLFYALILAWYMYALRTQQFPGPFNDPLRLFGIFGFVLILVTLAYTLRRRFMRGLPGKVQNWLWMHTWLGITTILIIFLHENFDHITNDFCTNFSCLTTSEWGTAAMFGLIILVISGITGRLFDTWQAHIVAQDASANGVGITRALEERILELEYTVERLCAGKSEPFKQYCLAAIDASSVPQAAPALSTSEQGDFQRASQTLNQREQLVQSLHRQQKAQRIMRIWRTIHIVIATLAMLVITYHSVMELLMNVFHVIPAS